MCYQDTIRQYGDADKDVVHVIQKIFQHLFEKESYRGLVGSAVAKKT